MAALSFNVSLGREAEFYNRVLYQDPVDCGFVLVVLANAGIESDITLKQYDTLADILANNDEVTNTDYERIYLLYYDLDPYTVDDATGSLTLPFPTVTFPSVDAGDLWRKLVIGYDENAFATSSPVDSEIIPVTMHDLFINGVAVSPNGNDIIISGGNGFLVAS